MRAFILSAFCLIASLTTGQAATLNETDFLNGFSNDFQNPTVVNAGFDAVSGGLSNGGAGADEFDFLHFTNLTPGAQTVSFTFSLAVPSGFSGFIGAGGTVRVKTDPFQFSAFEGIAQNFQLSFDSFNPAGSTPTQTLSFNLDSSFAGNDLFVGLRTTNSTQPFSFGIAVPGNAVAPVPVPASGLLLLTVFGLGGALRRIGRTPKEPVKHLSPA